MNLVVVRRLTTAGINSFRAFLSALRTDPSIPAPIHLLSAEGSSEPLKATASVDLEQKFQHRYGFAQALHEALKEIRDADANWMNDDGMWTWLALAYFQKTSLDGKKAGEDARHIISTDYRRRYRHLVRTAVLAFANHGENARFVLVGRLHTHGDAAEQLLSRQQILTNKALFAAFNALYCEDGKNGPRMKRGATSKDAGGTLRRAGKVLRQFDLTFDLQAMDKESILKLLPREFTRFKPKAG